MGAIAGEPVPDKRRMILDRVLLWLVRLRLARFRNAGDAADRFGDALIGLLSGEIERRKRLYADWTAGAADRARRRLAVEQFKGFASDERARLQ